MTSSINYSNAIHSSRHGAGGADEITPGLIGADVAGAAAAAAAASDPAGSAAAAVVTAGTNADTKIADERVTERANQMNTYARHAHVDVAAYDTPQLAIDAAAALGIPAVVVFPDATYTLASALTVSTSNIVLDLGRAVLVSGYAGIAVSFAGVVGAHLTSGAVIGGRIDLTSLGTKGIYASFVDGFVVRDTAVINGAALDGGGVHVISCTDVRISGVRVDTIGSGVAIEASTRVSVIGCVLKNAMRDGVLIYNNSTDIAIANNTISVYNTTSQAGRGGIQAYGSQRVTVTGNTIDSGASGGTSDSPKIRFRDSRDFTCAGNYVTGLQGGGIVVIANADIGSGAGIGTITGNTIRNVSAAGIQTALSGAGTAADLYPIAISSNFIYGVRTVGGNPGQGMNILAGSDAVTITGNHIEDVDAEGIFTAAASTITGNTIRQIGKGATGTKAGIYVSAGTSLIVGNYIIDDAGVPTMSNGIRVPAGSVAQLAGNRIIGAVFGAYRNDGTMEAQVGGIATALIGFYGKAPVARPAAITTPTAPSAAYVQAEAAAMKTAVDAIRAALTSLGLTA